MPTTYDTNKIVGCKYLEYEFFNISLNNISLDVVMNIIIQYVYCVHTHINIQQKETTKVCTIMYMYNVYIKLKCI